MYVPAKVEDRIHIVKWLLSWGKENGYLFYNDGDSLKYSDDGGATSHWIDWRSAASIARLQEIRSSGQGLTVPKPSRRENPMVYPRVANRYSKQKEKK
jgi:hypothetical protein